MKTKLTEDNRVIQEDVIKEFDLRSQHLVSFSQADNCFKSAFVGIVVNRKGDILFSAPKHYTTGHVKSSDISLVLHALTRYNSSPNTPTAETENVSFPFSSFKNISEYYRQFGLYRYPYTTVFQNGSGTIYWKQTIQKATAIISGGNIILTPLLKKETILTNNIVTDAMAYVLVNNRELLKMFSTTLRPVDTKIRVPRISVEYNKKLVRLLNRELPHLHRDLHKKLVLSLIDFLLQSTKDRLICFTTTNFENVWEDAVFNYANKHFELLFPTVAVQLDRSEHAHKFVKKEIKVDTANDFVIIPDGYYQDKNNLILIDAKYYSALDKMNYKQLVYDVLLGANQDRTSESYSQHDILITPTEATSHSKVHVDIMQDYLPNKHPIKIENYCLNTKEALKSYISET